MADYADVETAGMKPTVKSAIKSGWHKQPVKKRPPEAPQKQPTDTDKTVFSPTEAKDSFLELCKRVHETRQRVYVRDKAGMLYLTLAPDAKAGQIQPIVVPAQRFKSHFARFSYLIKDGMTFEIRLRDAGEHIIARRHQKYHDPLQDIINEWHFRLRQVSVDDEEEQDEGS